MGVWAWKPVIVTRGAITDELKSGTGASKPKKGIKTTNKDPLCQEWRSRNWRQMEERADPIRLVSHEPFENRKRECC